MISNQTGRNVTSREKERMHSVMYNVSVNLSISLIFIMQERDVTTCSVLKCNTTDRIKRRWIVRPYLICEGRTEQNRTFMTERTVQYLAEIFHQTAGT